MSHKYSSLPLRVTGTGLGATLWVKFFHNEVWEYVASESSASDADGGKMVVFLHTNCEFA